MTTYKPTLERKLEIRPGNIVYVPGCEPLSNATTGALVVQYRYVCKRSFVNLHEILEQIPEARIEVVPYSSSNGRRMRYIVFPDDRTQCGSGTDWFGLLREIANQDQPEVETNDCETTYSNNCDFQGCDENVIDPYLSASTTQAKYVLPPIAPWQIPTQQ